MRYHIFRRLWIGLGVGTVIGMVITLLISYIHGSGAFLPVMPALERFFEREVDAVAVQFALFGLIGVVFAEAGILFSLERLNFAMKCVLHFSVTSVFFIPFLWICYFNQEPIWKLLIIVGNLIFTYIVSWFISYMGTRAELKELNRKIEEQRRRRM